MCSSGRSGSIHAGYGNYENTSCRQVPRDDKDSASAPQKVLPYQLKQPIPESANPGEREYQRDGEGFLRPDAVENASEAEHDTGPLFSFS